MKFINLEHSRNRALRGIDLCCIPLSGDDANRLCPQAAIVFARTIRKLTRTYSQWYVPYHPWAGTMPSTKDKVSPTDLKAFERQLPNCTLRGTSVSQGFNSLVMKISSYH